MSFFSVLRRAFIPGMMAAGVVPLLNGCLCYRPPVGHGEYPRFWAKEVVTQVVLSEGKLMIQPDPVYVKVEKQIAHWYFCGGKLEIRFESETGSPFTKGKIECSPGGHCYSTTPPDRFGVFKYTATVMTREGRYEKDPIIVTGNGELALDQTVPTGAPRIAKLQSLLPWDWSNSNDMDATSQVTATNTRRVTAP